MWNKNIRKLKNCQIQSRLISHYGNGFKNRNETRIYTKKYAAFIFCVEYEKNHQMRFFTFSDDCTYVNCVNLPALKRHKFWQLAVSGRFTSPFISVSMYTFFNSVVGEFDKQLLH